MDWVDGTPNGQYDFGEDFVDSGDFNGIWNDGEDYTDTGNGEYDYGKYKGSANNHHFVIENVIETLRGNTQKDATPEQCKRVIAFIEDPLLNSTVCLLLDTISGRSSHLGMPFIAILTFIRFTMFFYN